MAEMLPKSPIGMVSSEIIKVFRRLKAIPGDEFRCRWALPIDQEKRPEFLIIYREQFVFLIIVSTVSQADAEAVLNPSFSNLLLGGATLTLTTFAQAEEECVMRFLLQHSEGEANPTKLENVVRIVFFPNVEASTLERIHQAKGSAFLYRGKEALGGASLGPTLLKLATQPIDVDGIEMLRKAFSPEVVIPRRIVRASPRANQVEAGFTEALLDYDQEHATKIDLSLSDEAEEVVFNSGIRLITGVAGSGKSLVLLYLAALRGKLHPEKSQILFTHNKPLIADLRSRLKMLTKSKACECIHFMKWCRSLARINIHFITQYEKRELIKLAAASIPGAHNFSPAFLDEEIEWLRDYEVDSIEVYLQARRIGRGRSLNEQQRRTVFCVWQKYQSFLKEKNCEDWSGLPIRVLKHAREGTIPLPRYDFVFVDEAQFFAPVWLKLIQMIVSPRGGQLVMAADPTQGFLKRRESWAASGLNVRGRSIKLKRAYRNTRSILEYAARFYRMRLPSDEEEINLPDEEQLARMQIGRPPEEVVVASKQDELTRICNEVRALLQRGTNPDSLLKNSH